MKVNVTSFFENQDLPGRTCIANSKPKGDKLPTMHILVPEWKIVDSLKRSFIDWDEFSRRYSSELDLRLRRESTLNGNFTERLVQALQVAAKTLNTDEITLCCWEGANNPKCHRKLLYSWLPKEVQGLLA